MRLIDADALNEKLCETTIFIKGGEIFQRMINDAPTIEPDGDTISRQDALAEFRDGRDVYDIMESIEALPSAQPNGDLISRQAAIRWVKTECNPYGKPTLDFESGKKVIEHLGQMPSAPSAEAEQVTGKLNNPDDSLLTADSEACKEQKSKLDLISRQAAIEAIMCEPPDAHYPSWYASGIKSLPSAPDSRQRGEWQKEIKGNGWNEWAVLTCDQCEAVIENPTFETNFCPNCGARMKGGAE